MYMVNFCPKCGKLSYWNSWFSCYICTNCGEMFKENEK